MVEKLINRLHEKGWTRDEIFNALEIISQAKKNKLTSIKFLDGFVYWLLLIIIVLVNFGLAIGFIPSMLSFNWEFLYFMLILFGWVFGLILELVIRSIEHLEKKHHIFLGFLIPIVAIANIIIIGSTSNFFSSTLNIGVSHNMYLAGSIYSLALITPYLIFKLILKKDYYSY